MALRVLRAIEEYCQHERIEAATLRVPPEVALYILNHKRAQLNSVEERNGVYIYIESVAALAASAYEIERGAPVSYAPRKPTAHAAVTVESELDANEPEALDEIEGDAADAGFDDEASEGTSTATAEVSEAGDGRRRRRRRRRGRDRDRQREPREAGARDSDTGAPTSDDQHQASDAFTTEDIGPDSDDEAEGTTGTGGNGHMAADGGDGQRKRRRRGRRGRRGRRFDETQGEPLPVTSGIGHLPTPAEALDAMNWPADGGLETIRGAAPATPAESTPIARPTPPPFATSPRTDTPVQRIAEPRTERPSIASFFGFGPKVEKQDATPRTEPPPPQEEASEAPKKRGWWQKRADG